MWKIYKNWPCIRPQRKPQKYNYTTHILISIKLEIKDFLEIIKMPFGNQNPHF